MARWCMRLDIALSDDGRFDPGCCDEWGTQHLCDGCPHNQYMGDGQAIRNTSSNQVHSTERRIDECQ